MGRIIKIAIYTGVIPSTTFIERLIRGLTKKELHVYLFGIQKRKSPPRKNTYYITYSNKLSKLLFLFKYSLLLTVFKAKDKNILDKIILNSNKNKRQLRIKYYPVLYHRPDIFHLQWAKSIEDWIWVQEFGIKIILSLRGAHINYSPIADSKLANKYKALFPKLDGFHAVSSAIKTEAMKYYAELNKIQVVYSGLDLKKISFQQKNFNSKALLNIVSIGREHWKKGYTYALNSMKIIKTMGIDFHYTIVGIGNNEELLYERSQLGLENEITFVEKLPFDEVLKSIQEADVLLLPSVEEGIANVVLEAMALGTLVLSTDCGGMNEVIIDNENGFIIPIRDAESIAYRLQKISNLPIDTYHRITKAARKTIKNQHSQVKMIDDMDTFYQTILNHKE